MTQVWYPPESNDWGIVCSTCQAVAWYKFAGSLSEAVKRLGGRLSTGRQFYCPKCATLKTDLQHSPENLEYYMREGWAHPNQLWHQAGLLQEPTAADSLLRAKVKSELIENAASEFSV